MILINPNPGKELEGGAVVEILIPGSLLWVKELEFGSLTWLPPELCLSFLRTPPIHDPCPTQLKTLNPNKLTTIVLYVSTNFTTFQRLMLFLLNIMKLLSVG